MQPLWTHDCKQCRFLGRVLLADAYICKSSVILRDGDDGPDYRSWPISIAREVASHDREYSFALKLAEPYL